MKNIILDTDLGGDCDDASAIALANKFHNENEINVLAMTYSNNNQSGALLASAINKYYGNDFPVGVLKNNRLIIEYGVDFVEKALEILNIEKDFSKLYNANDLIYDKLVKATDKSVTIICIGQLRNIATFLDDNFNGVSGTDIFNRKVKELYIMGGYFNQKSEYHSFCGYTMSGEYNIITDLNSAHTIMEKVKTEIIFCDFDVGLDVLTFEKFSTDYNEKHPVSVCYKLYQNGARHSWDPLTVLYAVKGDNEYFDSKTGNVVITDKGRTIFSADTQGKHKIVLLKKPKTEVAKYLESFFSEELK